jgi:hypothetical protein
VRTHDDLWAPRRDGAAIVIAAILLVLEAPLVAALALGAFVTRLFARL